MKRYLLRYIEENRRGIIIFLGLLLIGLFIGIVSYNFMPQTNKQELINSIKTVLDMSKQPDFNGIDILKIGLQSNLILISIIILSSLTFIAPVILCLIYILKGFALGVYVDILFSIFGFGNGLLTILLLIIIPNILYLPSMLYIGINALNFHYDISDKSNNSYLAPIVKQCYELCIAMAIIILSMIIEQSLSYVVFSIYAKI